MFQVPVDTTDVDHWISAIPTDHFLFESVVLTSWREKKIATIYFIIALSIIFHKDN